MMFFKFCQDRVKPSKKTLMHKNIFGRFITQIYSPKLNLDPFYDPRVPAFRRIGPHRLEIYSLFYGALLGNGYAEKHGFGTRLTFHQSSIHVDYLYWLHKQVYQYGYCNTNRPSITKQIGRGGKVYYSLKFRTWTFSSFNPLYTDWYNQDGIKVLPQNIETYLNPTSLAVIIMDDGSYTGYGIKIATDCFSKEEVYRLQTCIENRFKFRVNVHAQKGAWRLYIPKKSIQILVPILQPLMCNSMLHKLGQSSFS